MTVVLKDFRELAVHFKGLKAPKRTVPGMAVSATIYIDAHIVMHNGDVRLAKAHGNKFTRAKAPRKIIKTYFKGNADGSTTITGRNAIANYAMSLLR